jgi:CHASE3 domain sensor protein
MRVRFTIFKQGMILIAIPLLFQLLFLALVGELQQRHAEAQARSLHTKEVLTQVQTVLAKLIDAETGSRGYAITQNSRSTEPYDAAVQEVPRALARLRDLVRDDPEQAQLADRLALKARACLAWHAENVRLLRGGAREAAALRMKTMQDKELLDDIRRDIAAFAEAQKILDDRRQEALADSQRLFSGLMVFGAVLSVASSAGMAYVFSRRISGRLATLADNAGRLAQGQALTAPLGGSDEIAQLDRAFHATAAERLRTEAAIGQLNADLENRINERTADLTEANRELALKNQENEMFVYSVSHDLRSPLVNLEGFSKELGLVCQDVRALLTDYELPSAVRDPLLARVDGDMAEAIGFIQSAVRRLSNIIDALLRL